MKILITRQLVSGFERGSVVDIPDDKAKALIAEGTATAELPAPSAEEIQLAEDEKKLAEDKAAETQNT